MDETFEDNTLDFRKLQEKFFHYFVTLIFRLIDKENNDYFTA